MRQYDHKKIEKKWQKIWEDKGIYKTQETDSPKCYVLDMFPYPSGEGLHVGHPKGYIATDIYSRFKKMNGYNILHPMGWDAFGLPAENFAIKNKIHPEVSVSKNIKRFKEQLSILGFSYDWNREINTTDPKYYKWTQWIFLQMFKKGLAYQSYEPINWCPNCKTGLANEDLDGAKCERCDTVVEKKPLRQWVLKITEYADRMLEDLDELNWPESIKESQRNWIGRSEGSEIDFEIEGIDKKIKVFTTRADTLFGATYCVLAPEHKLLDELKDNIKNWEEVEGYKKEVEQKTEIERTKEEREKTGVKLEGIFAVNPANKEKIPVFVADYVLGHYGTGAVMAVPAHDQRDFEFAKKFGLPIIEVIKGGDISKEAFVGDGILVNSGEFNGMDNKKAKKAITEYVGGKITVKYKLQDWVFSRQRYWGEPIPIVHCSDCGAVAVPEEDLPVELPKVQSYEPTGTGESPLAGIKDWVNTKCPKCGKDAKRETNTMPQWAGSCWYYLRYEDPKNDNALVDKQKEKYWSPVDVYVGGAEHATRHLIYARFWHKFLYDIGVVSYKEPFLRLQHVGLINAEDGRKMSKRWGNVINPDDIVKTYGADTLRVYEMFMGPFDQGVSWSTKSIIGARRFLEKVWKLSFKVKKDNKKNESLQALLHKTIKKVSEDIESFDFNTAISQLMILANQMEKEEFVGKDDFKTFILLLSPFAPHIADELWEMQGLSGLVYEQKWPEYDQSLIKEQSINFVIQVNGKVRDVIKTNPDISEREALELAQKSEKVKKWIEKKGIKKIIFVKGRLINIIV